MTISRGFAGELIGTFLLVFFGCGSVCASVLTGAQSGVFQVAIVWGIGIALAIHLTSALSGAHLNPAVTIAMTVFGGFPRRQVLPWIGAQLLGAFVAAAVLCACFSGVIGAFENLHGIARGAPGSEASAMVFGEYFPNPGGKPLPAETARAISPGNAFLIEFIGTAVLLFVICGLTDEKNTGRPGVLTPLGIGLTVTLLISLLGPLTMACFNPARDLAPRVFSSLAGWGNIPWTVNGTGWLTVYILAPIAGGLAGAGIYHLLVKPLHAATGVVS